MLQFQWSMESLGDLNFQDQKNVEKAKKSYNEPHAQTPFPQAWKDSQNYLLQPPWHFL